MYFGYQCSVRCRIVEDLFAFCRLSICPIDGVLCLTEPFQFNGVLFTNRCSYCLSY